MVSHQPELPSTPSTGPTRHGKKHYLTEETSIRSWLFTTDHKRIGVLFFLGIALSLFLGGLFALLLRLEHLTPDKTVMEATTYNRMFTLHGVVMVWMFMIPSIPSAFGNFVLPIMLGAREIAFPRLNLLSFYIYLLGSMVLVLSLYFGGVDTGWTFYTPYSAVTPTAVVPVLVGVFIIGFSTIITGVNFIATTHTMRDRRMGWLRMPLFVWAVYATSIIQVLATPVLGMSLALVLFDRVFDFGFFDPARGGDPVLYQHLFWFYSHPAVYIMILPAMGVVTEVVCTFSHKNPASYRAIAYSSLGIAFVGFLTWGHHMFVAGMSTFNAGIFGVLSMLVAIFSAIKVYSWTMTMRQGSISLAAPLLYVFAFLILFIFGGLTGVGVATMSLDVHWHDTYFVVAHFHYIMVGGTLTMFLAALHYWFPLVTGRMYSEKFGVLAAAMVFAGFIVTFGPQYLLGNAGMPRRYFDYPEHLQSLHVISTMGSWILGGGLMLTVGYLTVALFLGRRAPANPWHSRSFEWRAPIPPPKHNFHDAPDLSVDAYDYTSTEQVDHGR